MAKQDFSEADILGILRQVQDPENERDIVSLGMVKEIRTEPERIFVRLEIAAPIEAVRQKIKRDLIHRLKSRFDRPDIEVQIFNPNSKMAKSHFSQKTPLAGIDRVIAVASGKGGVGKTTVAVNLACALNLLGFKVGLMDGDIYGPNVPLMLGIDVAEHASTNEEGKMIPFERFGLRIFSIGLLVPADQPMIWRGPVLHNAITQFLEKVDWGRLDYLIVDLPPGTGDVLLSLVQTVPVSGAVIVTTPQEVSLMDARRSLGMFQETEVPILGVIENMTGEIFGFGGGEEMARQFQVPFLGEIPLDVRIRECGDQGSPAALTVPETGMAQTWRKVAERLIQCLEQTAKI